MSTVFLSNEFRDVADQLAKRQTKDAGKSIFPNYMELMVFAAMVGYSKGSFEKLASLKHGPEIPSEIFVRNSRDGLTFFLALQEKRSTDVLRDKNEAECWNLLEGYANGGLKIINDWLLSSPADIDGVATLLLAIKEEAALHVTTSESNPLGPIDI